METPYETLHLDVNVHQHAEQNDTYGMTGMIAGQALKEYLACISGKMDVNTWVEKALVHVG